jgi:uncharacterized protein
MRDMFIDIYKIGPEGRSFDEPVLEDAEQVQEGEGARVLKCSRCVESFESAISTDFYLNLVPDGVEFGVGETEVSEESAALFYATEGKADLGVIAAEQLNLNLPLKPVCHDACKGLCATCGANRNRIECGCRSEDLDPRLAPLLEFKKPTNDA